MTIAVIGINSVSKDLVSSRITQFIPLKIHVPSEIPKNDTLEVTQDPTNIKPKQSDSSTLDFLKLLKRDCKDYSVLPDERQKELAILAQAGDNNAYKELVLSNVRLVIKTANSFCEKAPLLRRHFSDLIGDGLVALCNSVFSFDPNNGTEFVPYAKKSITNEIKASIGSSNEIHAPRYLFDWLGYYLHAVEKLQEESKELTDENILTAMEKIILETHDEKSAQVTVKRMHKELKHTGNLACAKKI